MGKDYRENWTPQRDRSKEAVHTTYGQITGRGACRIGIDPREWWMLYGERSQGWGACSISIDHWERSCRMVT